MAQDIVRLALFDVVLYIDDSGSMAFEENGARITDLKLILSRVAFAASLFDDDGVQVRFMKSPIQGDNIRSEQQVNDLVSRVHFAGLTPIGTELKKKIVDPLLIQPARAGQLRKPVLVITITDGQPTGEANNAVADTIIYASSEMARTRYGKGAVAFQFAQVGNDLEARKFLSQLDEHPVVGDLIDCTSSKHTWPLGYYLSMLTDCQTLKLKQTRCSRLTRMRYLLRILGSSNCYSAALIPPMTRRTRRRRFTHNKEAMAPHRQDSMVLLRSKVATVNLQQVMVNSTEDKGSNRADMASLLQVRAGTVSRVGMVSSSRVDTVSNRVDTVSSREDMESPQQASQDKGIHRSKAEVMGLLRLHATDNPCSVLGLMLATTLCFFDRLLSMTLFHSSKSRTAMRWSISR